MEWRRKRKAAPTAVPVADEGDILKLTPLGAGNEVGRSCILLQYKGKTVMLDCGLHPAYSGLAALPFFDDIDPSSIDLILITHFHVDHAAGLPYFMEKTTFKGRVFMTHPTRAIYKWLLADYVKISSLSPDDQLYNENDLAKSFERIEVVDYHQEVDVGGIKFTPYNAGHVLGAAMFLLEIAGVRILYTGDYSREEDRHLMAAERPPHVTPEVLICESTYGVQSHEPRLDRETRFTRMVHTIVKRGGRCLLPVFALGRAQELLLILDEYWQAHPDLHSVPIYYASSLAKKCMTVYQTYTNMMNTRIREQIKTSNPFQFKHISNLRSIAHFDDVGPCVMMASPGMLQSGLSRELLELWCTDRRNGVIIPGYVVEGTLGKQILSQPEEIPSMNGSKLPLRLTVEYISFSAHVDYKQNSEFIEDVGSPNLVLVHGDSNEMSRLRSALQRRYSEREVPLSIFTPRNCETVELVFRGEKMAKVIGILAKAEPEDGTVVEGLLVSKDFAFQMMAPEDLVEFTDLSTANVVQRQSIATRAPFGLVKWHLEQMYGSVKVVGSQSLRVFDTVTVTMKSESDAASKTPHALLEWESNPVNDMIADTVLAVLLQADTSPASVKGEAGIVGHYHAMAVYADCWLMMRQQLQREAIPTHTLTRTSTLMTATKNTITTMATTTTTPPPNLSRSKPSQASLLMTRSRPSFQHPPQHRLGQQRLCASRSKKTWTNQEHRQQQQWQ
ncbi:beta-lactamase-like protein [Entophlyctis helioformis]|nr:beta-lactamase-like protein [Entophlyctis helioformis]